MTQREIAEAFSAGNFEITYPFLSENIVWTVIGENQFIGKSKVMENCNQTAKYFETVSTEFKTQNIICDNNHIAINGTAEFKREGKTIAFVSACDLYEFNDDNMITRIDSYCIQEKVIELMK